MPEALLYSPIFQVVDANGNPYSGAKAFFYLTGTTTDATVYEDDGLTTPHSQPVVADASGAFDPIYLDYSVTYKLVLKDSSDQTIRTIDPIPVSAPTDDPQFTTIELGHASDTTISRGAAGFIAVEGKRVPSPASQAQYDMLVRGATEWERLAIGSNGQVVKVVSGAPAWGGPITLVSAASATGSSVTYSNIPSWARQIIISFYEVSLSGTDDILVQIGDSGGVETSGYVSSGTNSAGTVSSTSGFIVNMSASGDLATGQMILTSLGTSNDYWVASFSGKLSTTSTLTTGGSKQLSPGPLTQIQIVPSGANTFDSGLFGVVYL